MGTLKITHGLPGSGKSTLAKEEIAKNPKNTIRVNRDDLRTKLFGEEYHKKNPNKKQEELVTQIQEQLIKDGLNEGKTVWVDDTNLNPRFVGRLFKLGKGHKVEQVHVDTPIDECLRRNKVRGDQGGRRVPEDVVRGMAKRAYDVDGNLKRFVLDSRGLVHAVPNSTIGSKKIDAYNKKLEERNPFNGKAVVFVDVDGTLINNGHLAQKYFYSGGKRDYDAFFRSVSEAPVNEEVVELANNMRDDGLNLVILTGRDDKYASELIKAVEKSGINVSRVISKKQGDYRPDFDFKKEIINEVIDEGFVPVHSIDDRARSIKVYEDMGIKVSKVAEYTKDNVPAGPGPYPVPEIDTVYGTGTCIRCGKPLKSGNNIGPVCMKKGVH